MAKQSKTCSAGWPIKGNEMLGRITELPGAKQLTDRVAALTKGLDDVQKRLRSLDPLERRVTQIEKRLDKLEGKGTTRKAPSRSRSSAAKSSSAKKSTAAKRSTTSRTTPRRSS